MGLRPIDYFRIARLPLKLFYRSGIRPGPGKDGQAVNARVLAEGWKFDFEGPTLPGQHPPLQIHLALANLSTRARKPWNRRDRSPAVPLRHRCRRALDLARDRTRAADGRGRRAAIPLLPQPRRCARRDRCGPAVAARDRRQLAGRHLSLRIHTAPPRPLRLARLELGRHHALRDDAGAGFQGPRRKAYLTEQILSSSLFRFYRCIGGDTTEVGAPNLPDIAPRESASHYAVYLIMRGIQMLGTSGIELANKPEQLVAALIHADTVTTGAGTSSFPL